MLAVGLGGSLAPTRIRAIGLDVQGFGLLGTLVGPFTMAIGVGRRSALDLVLHATMVALLVAGEVVARRTP